MLQISESAGPGLGEREGEKVAQIKEQRETSTTIDATALIDGERSVWPTIMPCWHPSDFVISQAPKSAVSNQEGALPDFTQKTELGKGEIANRRTNQLIRWDWECVRLIPRFRVS